MDRSEINMKKKLKLFMVTFTVAVVGIGLAFVFYKPDRVINYETEFAFDITDKELLVGDAPHVIVGEVVRRVEETTDDIGPITVYTIEVQEELKGALETNTLPIVQRIGYDNLKKGVVKYQDDQYLVEGNSYVFSLRYDEMIGMHRITSPKYGNILAKEKKDQSYKDEVIADFKEAVKNQKKPQF